MIVEDIMKSNVITLSQDDSILDAIKLMESQKIRHLPIVEKNQNLIGIVTDRDIRDAAPSIFEMEKFKEVLKKPLKMIMTTNVITGHPLDFVEEISAILYEHRIGCLPILKNRKLVGIVTKTDLLHTLIQLTGALEPGSQIEIKVPNKAGALCEVIAIIGNRKANIQSVLVYPDQKDVNYKIIVLRVQTMNPLNVINDLTTAGYHVLWPNHPGQSS